MNMSALHDRLQSFLHSLRPLDPEERKDAVMNEVSECGGNYTIPPTGENIGSALIEISLHQIVAFGADEEEAIRNWTNIAERRLPTFAEAS